MSAGWGRFQGEGTGPDWLAPEDGDEAAPEWAAGPSGPAEEAGTREETSGWATLAAAAGAPRSVAEEEPPAWLDEPDEEAPAPSGWQAASADPPHRSFAKPARQAKSTRAGKSAAGRSGFGEGGSRKASGSRQSGVGKPAGQPAWQSRRKDRAPGEEPAPEKPQSREKLEQRAKNILLYHLARQMQTRSQLADRLRKKEIPDDIAAAVLDRFEELHLLDDATYAETFVRSRHQERGLAKRALGYELRKRGVDNDTAEEALATLDEDQEAQTARRLVEGRLRSTRNLDQQVRVRRLVGMLARKGYSSSVAMRAVKEALAEEGERLDVELDPGIEEALDDAGLE